MVYLNYIDEILRFFPVQSGDIVELQSVRIKPEGAPDSAYVQIIDGYKGVEGTDHYWEFPGAQDIIRAALRLSNIAIAELSVTHAETPPDGIGGQTFDSDYTVLFTGALLLSPPLLSAEALCQGRFLHVEQSAWLMPGQTFSLFYYLKRNQVGMGLPMLVSRMEKDGTVRQFNVQTDSGLSQVEFDYNGDVALDTVTFGARTFCFWYIDAPVVELFRFRNVFNLRETVSVQAAVTEKPETEFDTAQCGSVLMPYDIEHNTVFSLATAPLPAFMYNTLLRLCRADSVQYRISLTSGQEQWRDIIITKYQINRSSAPDTHITLQMDFRYADTRLNNAADLWLPPRDTQME